jgi:hypothetical protein
MYADPFSAFSGSLLRLNDVGLGRPELVRMLVKHFKDADRLIRVHGLARQFRTLDALQLAVALDLRSRGMLDMLVSRAIGNYWRLLRRKAWPSSIRRILDFGDADAPRNRICAILGTFQETVRFPAAAAGFLHRTKRTKGPFSIRNRGWPPSIRHADLHAWHSAARLTFNPRSCVMLRPLFRVACEQPAHNIYLRKSTLTSFPPSR